MGYRKRAIIAAANTRRLEMPVQLAIVTALNARPDVWAMVNARGSRKATGGLLWPGSADIIGIIQREAGGGFGPSRPELAGVFFALEVKRPVERGVVNPARSKTRPDQDEFLERVRAFGGISGVVRSVEDALVVLGLRAKT